jgi:hypothetical protein
VVAQTSQATLRGNITDSSHAVVIGASLVLENVETHIKASTISNSAGDYLFQNITPGTYTVLASQKGFTAQRVKPFSLGVNQATTIDFVLPVGQVNEIVEVTAVGEGVESSTTELGSTLQTEQIGDLPLNGRNFTNLFTTVPGVSTIVVGGSQTNSYNVAIGAGNIIPSVHGQTNRSDLFVVDGLLDIETFGDAYAVQPVIDIIQDQKLQSHNDSAEFGGSTGGTINISTKSRHQFTPWFGMGVQQDGRAAGPRVLYSGRVGADTAHPEPIRIHVGGAGHHSQALPREKQDILLYVL